MDSRVLVPIDGSEQAWEACEFAIEEFPESELVLLHIIDPAEAGYTAQASVPNYSEEWYERAKSEAESLFAEGREMASDRDVVVSTDTAVGKPARAIVEYAEDEDVDHVIMGSHGRSGVSRILLGSVAENVVRNSPVPVTVTR